MSKTVSSAEIRKIVEASHHDPFSVLGAHSVELKGHRVLAIRAYLPDAKRALVVNPGGVTGDHEMERLSEDGFFEAILPDFEDVVIYELKNIRYDGSETTFRDPYSFLPTLTDFDIYLFNAGDHHRLYEKLGAHRYMAGDVEGIQFAVWAPNARSVSVIGDFNQWDGRRNPMRVLGSSGIWELFIPGMKEGALYKFQVKPRRGPVLDKTDPFATEMETRPRTASKVNFLEGFTWEDENWIRERATEDSSAKPVAVYEVHLGSWMRHVYDNNRWMSYRELAEKLVEYVKQRGFTHIELLPIMEHPFDGSWGYQVTGYFAPTSRFGTPQDFMYFVNHCHRNDIGVILDWVPAHFPKDSHALARFDGTSLYEHEDPRKGEHQDWGTLIFNFGRNEVRNFLLSNALFWLDKYHIDGIRIDAVASMLYLDYSRKAGHWIPNQYGGRENLEAISFLRHLNDLIHKYAPGVLSIAEESTAWPGVTNTTQYGGLGFNLKWNMGWMHDMLEYYSKDPIHRSFHHGKLTFALLYAFSERFLLPLSHDEVVHGKSALVSKMPGDEWQQFANLRLLFGLMYGFPGKKLIFMGCEFGQKGEWNHDTQLDWYVLQYPVHAGVQRWIDDLNKVYKQEKALHEIDFHYSGFEWIDFMDEKSSIISFLRRGRGGEKVLVVCSFTPVPRSGYRIGVPDAGRYREILNSDSSFYGGSNMGNNGEIESEAIPYHGRPFSLSLTVPPLSAIFLKAS